MTYIEHLLAAEGLKADFKKIKRVRDLPILVDVKGPQRFTGMIHFLSKFCPDLVVVAEPVHELTWQNVKWE